MSQSTLLVLLILAVIVVIAAGIGIWQMQRTRLRPLPDESKRRYASSWRAIEARFIEEPRNAIHEADQTAVALLQERGAKLDDDRHIPDDLRRAREAARAQEGEQGTEGMRKAMLHYKAMFIDAVGESARESDKSPSREVA